MIVSIRLIVLVIAFSAVVMAAPSFGDEIVWRPVTQEELQMKTPKVEADADAEAIFWEVRLDDKKLSSVRSLHPGQDLYRPRARKIQQIRHSVYQGKEDRKSCRAGYKA